jgi:enoyl-[acyl-carrier-protein] reductase (NADH)
VARRAAADGVSEDEARKRLYQGNLLGRVVDARDIANVVTFLVSPKGSIINGDVVAVGGGVPRVIYY